MLHYPYTRRSKLPVYQELVDFNKVFKELKTEPIIINDLANATEEEKNRIRDLIQVRYSGDMLSMLPTCRCGETQGEHAVGIVKCDKCGTYVTAVVEEEIEPIVWFRAPEGVTKLVNPIIWIMLRKRLLRSGFDVLQWLCDKTYVPNVKRPGIVDLIQKVGLERGYNNFILNFDEYVNKLLTLPGYKVKRNQSDLLMELIRKNRFSIFSDYLPLPNKSLLVIEQTNVGTYIDPTIVGALDAIEIVTGIDAPTSTHSLRVKENRAVKAVSKLAQFYTSYFKESLGKKPGIFRRHVYGSRTHFCFRAVITSLTDAHRHDEVHAPWCVGVTAFRPHLINKLMRMGFGLNDAIGFLNGHVNTYHPVLDKLLDELIEESPGKRIPIIVQRN
jgi:hypothetical protein